MKGSKEEKDRCVLGGRGTPPRENRRPVTPALFLSARESPARCDWGIHTGATGATGVARFRVATTLMASSGLSGQSAHHLAS